MKRIFVIDDEVDMQRVARDLLEADGYLVQCEKNPDQALKTIQTNPPDLVLLDIRMPEKDGFQVCKELKANPKTKPIPIIMISVKSEEADVVLGLELGAEDYICKPFRKREMMARIKTILRRRDPETETQILESGPIRMDFESYSARVSKRPIKLTPKEFELLALFIRREGAVLRRSVLSDQVWGMEFTGSTRTIDVHVDQLRRKLGKYGAWIKGLKGIGYRFEPED